MTTIERKDLIVLVADSHIKSTVDALLEERYENLGISKITFETILHRQKDSGCRTRYLEMLRLYSEYRHACVIFDRHGSEAADRWKTEKEIERTLSRGNYKQS